MPAGLFFCPRDIRLLPSRQGDPPSNRTDGAAGRNEMKLPAFRRLRSVRPQRLAVRGSERTMRSIDEAQRNLCGRALLSQP